MSYSLEVPRFYKFIHPGVVHLIDHFTSGLMPGFENLVFISFRFISFRNLDVLILETFVCS